MKKTNFVPIIVFLIISALYTLSLADAPQGLTFLTIGVGGRATGMGEAAVAITDDPMAAYWNPAGLAAARTSGAVFMFNRWIQDVSGQFAAGNYRRGHSISRTPCPTAGPYITTDSLNVNLMKILCV